MIFQEKDKKTVLRNTRDAVTLLVTQNPKKDFSA
jgi:hypothetical protein